VSDRGEWQAGFVWCLDPANSAELMARLRRHGRGGDFEVAWVGEGWRSLVEECHERLVAAFPEYELLAIKQKYGVLSYQAFPGRWVEGQRRWSADEAVEMDAITEEFRARSESVCEWCGVVARLRDRRTVELTLCDACDRRFPDPPYQVHRVPR
jgi:hypothetical protein